MRVAALLVSVQLALALDNGLGRTPAMGYNTWNDFRCDIDAADIMDAADAIVSQGLNLLGYEYVNMDDCWALGRYANGTIYPDPSTFPDGVKAVADYVHSKGLKFGLYTDRGTETCAGRPGSLGHENIDAQTYAGWGVDYLKEDSCYACTDHTCSFDEYGTMRDALNATGRPIYFSLCGWNSWYAPVGASLGNSWRIAGDCNTWPNVINAINVNAPLSLYASPGSWNDPDMLIGTNPQAAVYLTQNQSRAMFSLWSVMAAPLLIGSSIIQLNPFDLETYSNKEVIAVDQDPLGKQGFRIAGGPLTLDPPVSQAQLGLCEPLASQQWTYSPDGYPAGALRNEEENLCLAASRCGHQLIYWDCVTAPTSSDGCELASQQFKFTGDRLVSSLPGNPCVTVMEDGRSLALTPCRSTSRQRWSLSGGQLKSGHTHTCLSAQSWSGGDFNVWLRPLTTGWAVLFLNNAQTPSDVICDQSCFAAANIALNETLAVRDLWAHEDLPNFESGTFTAPNLPAQGGFALYTWQFVNKH